MRWKKICEKQLWHGLFILGTILGFILIFSQGNWFEGILFGIGTKTWTIITITTAFLHQIYVWFGFRFQLYLQLFTRKLGRLGFKLYTIGFFILFYSRIGFSFLLAYSNCNSFYVNSILMRIIAGIMLIPMLYAWYSVMRYFGIYRAAGEDHFEENYKEKPFVKKGIYRFTRNGMYTFATFIFIIPGLIFVSQTALIIGIFNYVYIWIHYLTVELPDIKEIYGKN